MTDLERGVTIDTVVGAYTGTERKRLVVFCSPRESVKAVSYTHLARVLRRHSGGRAVGSRSGGAQGIFEYKRSYNLYYD